jgi:hypothetical protein
MAAPDPRNVARRWLLARVTDERQTPTQFHLEQLGLPVSDARFDRAMEMAARYMGGTYLPATGTIRLPREAVRPGDKSFPSEITVLYRKFPCAYVMKGVRRDSPGAGMPCVSFDAIPNVPGDPRRSRIYQSFRGEAGSSKVLFGKFLGWLRIIGDAVRRYVRQRDGAGADGAGALR